LELVPLGGKDIRKWSERLYEELVEAKKQSSQVTGESVPKYSENDPIAVLKLRLAKGEITSKEYERIRRGLVFKLAYAIFIIKKMASSLMFFDQ
jgi:histone deacetylase complex regulatory component SIN3